MQKQTWVTRDINAPAFYTLQNVFHTRVVIENAPSGQIYAFEPGEVRDDVLPQDREHLLNLIQNQSACCGSQPGQPLVYFKEI